MTKQDAALKKLGLKKWTGATPAPPWFVLKQASHLKKQIVEHYGYLDAYMEQIAAVEKRQTLKLKQQRKHGRLPK